MEPIPDFYKDDNMVIHPEIKRLQERTNRVAKEFDIEDDVISEFNRQIAYKNRKILIDPTFIIGNFDLFSDEYFADHIYLIFNIVNKL